MSQATPTTLAAKAESLGEADLLPFHELLDAAIDFRVSRAGSGDATEIAFHVRLEARG